MNFCSHCGSDQLDLRIPEGDNRERFVCSACGTIHYLNPKIVAGCLPVWEGKVLLCRRAIEPRRGYWNVPSGYLENGESVEAGALRELWEEAEARVALSGLHAIYSIPHINQVYIHFLGELLDGAFGVGEESLETRLFAEEEVPWTQIAFTSSTFTLERFFADQRAGRRRFHLGSF
ncbi:MAG: NUDIX hydrolase [Saprospiraceae bacterium]|nr:NUDIX hydrolase [Saprospiraceae bacterium]MCB0678915.1 NUDIX hydrolase [Saprospiraceae bacterium]